MLLCMHALTNVCYLQTHCGAHNDLVFGVCFVDTCIGTFHVRLYFNILVVFIT